MDIDRVTSANATWDPRLITRERAANLAGNWRLRIDNQQPDIVFMRCSVCDGNVMQLPQAGKLIDVDSIISGVLAHMVRSHNYTLSGGEQRGTDTRAV